MAQKRLPMRKVRKMLELLFDEGRSARAIATHCGLARRSVGQTLERFAASGLSWPEAADMDDVTLEAALYPRCGRFGLRTKMWIGQRLRGTFRTAA